MNVRSEDDVRKITKAKPRDNIVSPPKPLKSPPPYRPSGFNGPGVNYPARQTTNYKKGK
jgi:hypothetical protein